VESHQNKDFLCVLGEHQRETFFPHAKAQRAQRKGFVEKLKVEKEGLEC
jgi:hypothetical protein